MTVPLVCWIAFSRASSPSTSPSRRDEVGISRPTVALRNTFGVHISRQFHLRSSSGRRSQVLPPSEPDDDRLRPLDPFRCERRAFGESRFVFEPNVKL